ncbi:hypothetical protein Q3G72_032081 [Acer saccharum]|nr:hypothetical protein Q3G72_032081 [Acer saccharum]
MMTGYCKEGMLDNARVLFEGIQCKDRVSFNAMISGYAQNGVGEEALSKCGGIVESELAFRQICSPNLVSWNTVIVAFARTTWTL